MLNRRTFVRATPGLLAAVLAAPAQGGEASGRPPVIGRSRRKPGAGDGVGNLDLGDRKSLRILQFTDNHFFCGVEGLTVSEDDRATERDWQAFVRVFRPDLLVLSGDLWHDNPGGRGQRTLELILPRLERLEIPWATCWGNHDQLDDFQAGHDALEATRNSLYRGGATHGDYRVEVRTRHGVAAQLWFLNSNQFGLTDWQLAWLRKSRAALTASPAVPALAFFHIPLLDQKTLYQRNRTPGVCQEEVCFERESGRALPVLAESGAIRATFCGHDHVNDYAVRARDVDLVYGRATGYSGYGGEKLRKGAKLIELDFADGRYHQRTVFADGTSWEPV
ncbi:MAG: metallophosphoesterase [Verrucomicrobiales bacterium]|nr:metallophosphoesterase [Verrucomicrobiales bacterium]